MKWKNESVVVFHFSATCAADSREYLKQWRKVIKTFWSFFALISIQIILMYIWPQQHVSQGEGLERWLPPNSLSLVYFNTLESGISVNHFDAFACEEVDNCSFISLILDSLLTKASNELSI